jgi:hypothetical protein
MPSSCATPSSSSASYIDATAAEAVTVAATPVI